MRTTSVHRSIARLACSSAGHGGQILISAATQALAQNRLPDGLSLRDLDEHRLKEWSERKDLPAHRGRSPADFPPT